MELYTSFTIFFKKKKIEKNIYCGYNRKKTSKYRKYVLNTL